MALTGAVWTRADVHVVRGVPSRRLDAELRLFDDTTTDDLFADNPPAHVWVRFEPAFRPEGPQAARTISGHGVSVHAGSPVDTGSPDDNGTGVVTVGPVPAGGRRLHTFLLTAVATDRNTGHEERQVIRVHVHDAVEDAWLTPSALTLRPSQSQFTSAKVSLLARFDDEVVGDIGNWSSLVWSTDPPSAVLPAVSDVQIVDPATGGVIARRTGASARLTVECPPLGLSRHAEVTCVEEWATPRELTWIAGRDPAKWREVTNLLFLPDGFVDGEEGVFHTLVRNIARKLRTTPVFRPFDQLHDAMNYWAAFLPSDEAGFSILHEMYTVEDPGGLAASKMPVARAPSATAERWSVAELLHEVGLPVKADAGRDLDGDDGLLEVWQRVYGPQVTRPRVEQSWQAWRKLATRTLINGRNTALGLTLGERPRVEEVLDTLYLSSDRVPTRALHDLVANLRHRGEPVGETWRREPPPRGKDHGLVCILVRTRMGRATNLGDVYTSALAKVWEHFVRPAAAGGVEIVPVRLKRRGEPMPPGEEHQPCVNVDDPPLDGVATVAHETGHSLLLGDEYAEFGQKDLPSGLDVSDDANLQDLPSLLSPTTRRLESARIKWASWHRIERAGVLAHDPDPRGVATDYRLTLRPGHASAFKKDDLVRLRRRPLVPDTLVSDVMRVKSTPAAGQAHVDVTVLFAGWTSPGHFRAGSVLMKMLRWPFRDLGLNLGEELTLMARVIRDHIDESQLPLNARRGRGLAACDFDHDGQQRARNLPSGLPKCRPRSRSRIVGLFEGGAQYHCGVFHPTGACLMRDGKMEARGLIPFCPVCRYVIVDVIDPTKHGIIDQDYARIYPDPRL